MHDPPRAMHAAATPTLRTPRLTDAPTPAPPQKRRRLTREDWIEAATRRLVARGIEAVRLESLARSLGVSRGSFYWHFHGRDELLQSILMRWREYQTRRIVERIREDVQLAPREKLARLRMLPARTRASREAAALELAIRAWSHSDKLARQVVEQVDAERIEFTRGLLREAAMDEGEAAYWALIGYAYTLGESLLRVRMSDAEITECRSRLLASQVRGIGSAPVEAVPTLRGRALPQGVALPGAPVSATRPRKRRRTP